jgi:hypothetical protein
LLTKGFGPARVGAGRGRAAQIHVLSLVADGLHRMTQLPQDRPAAALRTLASALDGTTPVVGACAAAIRTCSTSARRPSRVDACYTQDTTVPRFWQR